MKNAVPTHLKIALAQLNPLVGDLEGNANKVRTAWKEAQAAKADLVVFPELFITGYPPEDLVLKRAFQDAARSILDHLAVELADGPGVLTGTIWSDSGKVYNAAALLDGGEISAVRYKVDLPNYGVFDEKRVFAAGPLPGPMPFRGLRLGTPICEDIWGDEVVECLAECGAELLIVPNGSPFDWDKPDVRLNTSVARVIESALPLVYLNQVGGQDELVFDGASFVLNSDRSLAMQMPAWREQVTITHWEKSAQGAWCCLQQAPERIATGPAAAYQASILGVRDYVNKNRFPSVVLGLSGGIDSALVAALATDALGAKRVHAVMLPYEFTSEASLVDAEHCAKALGVRYDEIAIHEAVEGITKTLASTFRGYASDVTEENIQSRLRGVILMALSNKFGSLLLTTGNKSEMSVGYATLYGDMNGGFNPIKDLYKTDVYRLARWRNENHPDLALGPAGRVIPENTLVKEPTAELRANQKDQDSLPPYDVLDQILLNLVENEMPVADIIAKGIPADVVQKVERLLYVSEYKRRQSAPGIKISSKNFGRDRRYPITNAFREKKMPAKSDNREMPQTAAGEPARSGD